MFRVIISIGVLLTLSLPAIAQSKKELAAQDIVLAERIARLEARMLTGDPAAEQLMQRMDALESEQRSLTGEIEQLRFERDNLKAEIAALNQDFTALEEMSDRMRLHLDAVDLVASERAQQVTVYGPESVGPNDVSTATGVVDPNQPSMLPSAPVSRDMTIPMDNPNLDNLPEMGKKKLYEGNFSGAQSDFQTYLAVSPDAPDAGEVNYWLGETFYVKGGYADAADAYIESMRKAPQGAKAPEALIRLAASLRELGNKAEACQALDSFPSQYPNAGADIREKSRIELARTGC